jgi:tripartite-type tricarboxylate transporter receptor subunit TctC
MLYNLMDLERAMSSSMRKIGWSRRAALGAALGVPLALRARAEPLYPARNPHLIVPFPAGGPADILARIASEQVSGRLGQQIIVDNRPGAGGNLAGETAARAEPDGYTLLVAGQSILAINKALYRTMSYDPAADFTFVAMLGVAANVLLVNPQTVPANSVAELVALAKQKPGALTYGSNGPGSLSHLTMEILARAAGVSLLHVPYRGAAPLMTDLIGGRVDMSFNGASIALPLAKSGQLKALAVTTPTRSRHAPDVPTLVESGFPDLDAPTWFAVVARAGTPAPILERLRAEFDAVVGSDAYARALDAHGTEPRVIAPAQAEAFLAAERKLWSTAVKATGVVAD